VCSGCRRSDGRRFPGPPASARRHCTPSAPGARPPIPRPSGRKAAGWPWRLAHRFHAAPHSMCSEFSARASGKTASHPARRNSAAATVNGPDGIGPCHPRGGQGRAGTGAASAANTAVEIARLLKTVLHLLLGLIGARLAQGRVEGQPERRRQNGAKNPARAPGGSARECRRPLRGGCGPHSCIISAQADTSSSLKRAS